MSTIPLNNRTDEAMLVAIVNPATGQYLTGIDGGDGGSPGSPGLATEATLAEIQDALVNLETKIDQLGVIPITGSIQTGTLTLEAGQLLNTVLPANPNRRFFFFQNQSSADLWLQFGGNANGESNSGIQISPGGVLTCNRDGVPTTNITVWGTSAGQKYVWRQEA